MSFTTPTSRIFTALLAAGTALAKPIAKPQSASPDLGSGIPTASGLTITSLTYYGDGCPEGTLQGQFCPETSSFNVTITELKAILQDGKPSDDASCHIEVGFKTESQIQLNLLQGDFYGSCYLESAGMTALAHSSVSFAGNSGGSNIPWLFYGPVDAKAVYEHNLLEVFVSQCSTGGDFLMLVDLVLHVTRGPAAADAVGYIDIDQLTGAISQAYVLQPSPCGKTIEAKPPSSTQQQYGGSYGKEAAEETKKKGKTSKTSGGYSTNTNEEEEKKKSTSGGGGGYTTNSNSGEEEKKKKEEEEAAKKTTTSGGGGGSSYTTNSNSGEEEKKKKEEEEAAKKTTTSGGGGGSSYTTNSNSGEEEKKKEEEEAAKKTTTSGGGGGSSYTTNSNSGEEEKKKKKEEESKKSTSCGGGSGSSSGGGCTYNKEEIEYKKNGGECGQKCSYKPCSQEEEDNKVNSFSDYEKKLYYEAKEHYKLSLELEYNKDTKYGYEESKNQGGGEKKPEAASYQEQKTPTEGDNKYLKYDQGTTDYNDYLFRTRLLAEQNKGESEEDKKKKKDKCKRDGDCGH
ncbi:uncharacterized protein J3D65DRAFT_442320 [Phyllosticta citribraziliensis]|uniref:Ubiquitin 3 binding protein But2 C-terminal domain-containing protein n=1 Tax=Phyllosticta citribraziliensis TaxID=989973 RepID=A0ABR1LIY7_9PEZI